MVPPFFRLYTPCQLPPLSRDVAFAALPRDEPLIGKIIVTSPPLPEQPFHARTRLFPFLSLRTLFSYTQTSSPSILVFVIVNNSSPDSSWSISSPAFFIPSGNFLARAFSMSLPYTAPHFFRMRLTLVKPVLPICWNYV